MKFGWVRKECWSDQRPQDFSYKVALLTSSSLFLPNLTCIIAANVRLSIFVRCLTAEYQNTTRYSDAISFLAVRYIIIWLACTCQSASELAFFCLNVKVVQLKGRHRGTLNAWEIQCVECEFVNGYKCQSQANCVRLESPVFIRICFRMLTSLACCYVSHVCILHTHSLPPLLLSWPWVASPQMMFISPQSRRFRKKEWLDGAPSASRHH